ncbi:MAG: hypothetical protein WAW87_08950 [Candidatus Ferrigenium altingense]
MSAIEATDQTIIYRRIIRIIWLDEFCATASRALNCDITEVNVAHNLASKNVEEGNPNVKMPERTKWDRPRFFKSGVYLGAQCFSIPPNNQYAKRPILQ